MFDAYATMDAESDLDSVKKFTPGFPDTPNVQSQS